MKEKPKEPEKVEKTETQKSDQVKKFMPQLDTNTDNVELPKIYATSEIISFGYDSILTLKFSRKLDADRQNFDLMKALGLNLEVV